MKRKTLKESFSCALSGLRFVLSNERNMKIHIAAALIATGLGFIMGISRVEWGLLSITIFMVLAAESANTALEKAVDLVTAEYHPLARTAKNVAAGAVLLSAINAVIIAFIIFGRYLF